MDETQTPNDPQSQFPSSQPSQSEPAQPHAAQPFSPQQQQYAEAPKNDNPPPTGTWLKIDARDPEAEAAEAAYLKESARVRRGVWIGNIFACLVVGVGRVFDHVDARVRAIDERSFQIGC